MRHLSFNAILCLVFVLNFQTPQETIRKHYEAAEAQRRAGNLVGAELEYTAIIAEAYEKLGEVYTAEEDYSRAIQVLETAASYRPNTLSVQIALSIARFGGGKYDAALVAASKAQSIDPQNAGAHQMLGKTYFMLGDLNKAIVELETATKLAPGDVEVMYTLGIAYLRNRQTDAAKQLYESMLKQFGDLPQLHIVIGRAYRQSGLLAEAANEFKKAIALDSHFPRAHYYLGITYLLDEGQSKLEEALQEFRIELEANPDEFFANYYLGVVYVYQRKWELAITALEKAVTIEPRNPDPYFQLGQAYQELNRHEKAVEALRKSIAFNPDLGHNKNQVTTAHHRLATSLLKLGQTEAGQKELQIASDLKAEAFKLEQQTQSSPAQANKASDLGLGQQGTKEIAVRDQKTLQELKNGASYFEKVVATAHNNVGLLRAERRDYVGAADQFALAVKWNPAQEGLDYNLALAYYKSGLFSQAINPLKNELKAHPENVQARVLLGMSSFMTENYVEAAESLTAGVDSSSGEVNTYYALACSLLRQNKLDRAQEIIDQMKRVTGDTPHLHLLVAEQSSITGDRIKLEAELKETSTGATKVVGLHYFAGFLFLKLGRPVDAMREFEAELVLNPSDLQTKRRLGEIQLANKQTDRAVKLFQELVQLRPEDAEMHHKLGQALLQKGDFAGAIVNLESAAKLQPEQPDVHFDLGQAYIAAGRKADGKNQIDLSKQLRTRRSND